MPGSPHPLDDDAVFGSLHDRRRQLAGLLFGMAWLAIPVVSTATSDPAGWRAALAIVLFPVALGFYVWGMEAPFGCTPLRRILVSIGAMVAIAILLTITVEASWAVLFSYVAAIAGMHLPPRLAVGILLVLPVLAFATNVGRGLETALSLAASAVGIGLLMLAIGRLIAANVALHEAQEEIERLAVAGERERFARDLHDLLGHSLSVIALKAELAGRLLPERPDEAARHVADLEGVAREALGEVRETVSGYRQPTLAGELAGARLALDAAGIEPRLHSPDEPLPADVEALLAWAVREGTTNVIRHSGARRCEIAIVPGDGRAVAEVRDDGAGADELGDGDGHGLEGLRERAAALHGQVEAGARDGGGFALRVTVPLGGGAA